MDIVSAFKSELFRPIVTIVVPGFVALSPYLFVADYYNPQILQFWESSPSAFIGILLMLVLAAGLILEDIGSRIEGTIWDSVMSRKHKEYMTTWDTYLKLCTKDDIIGQRYLRTILMRLKFELSMGPALLISLGGLIWCNAKWCIWERNSCLWMSFVITVTGLYLLWESYDSVNLLARVRQLVIEAVKEQKKVKANEKAQQKNQSDAE